MPKIRKTPQRQCVACGQTRAKRELVRIVRTPAGEVRVDPTGKLSGRGAYVCPSAACADRALRDGRLAGALERPIPEELIPSLREAVSRPAPPRAPVVRRIPLGQSGKAGLTQSGKALGTESGRAGRAPRGNILRTERGRP